MYTIYTDGGSRGNPGPAAIGITIDKEGQRIHSFGKYLGTATNNVAEHTAVYEALKYLCSSTNNERGVVHFFLDSELVVRQLTGVYKIKDASLKSLAQKTFQKIEEWGNDVIFTHVKREFNKEADLLVNKELDTHESSI